MKSKAVAPTMQGTWLRDDEGQHWIRLLTPTGDFDNEARCRAVRVHPDRPGEVLAGTDQGLYRNREESGRFDPIPSPMDSPQVLQIAQDPREPDFIVRGTRPGVAFIFEDNGGTGSARSSTHPRSSGSSTRPGGHRSISIRATVETGGVFRSVNRGRTRRLPVDGLHDNDTHDLVFRDKDGKRTVLCSTEEGVHRSGDNGESWQQIPIPESPRMQFRSLKQPCENSDTVIAPVGDKPSGKADIFLIRHDFGETRSRKSHEANSTLLPIKSPRARPGAPDRAALTLTNNSGYAVPNPTMVMPIVNGELPGHAARRTAVLTTTSPPISKRAKPAGVRRTAIRSRERADRRRDRGFHSPCRVGPATVGSGWIAARVAATGVPRCDLIGGTDGRRVALTQWIRFVARRTGRFGCKPAIAALRSDALPARSGAVSRFSARQTCRLRWSRQPPPRYWPR